MREREYNKYGEWEKIERRGMRIDEGNVIFLLSPISLSLSLRRKNDERVKKKIIVFIK